MFWGEISGGWHTDCDCLWALINTSKALVLTGCHTGSCICSAFTLYLMKCPNILVTSLTPKECTPTQSRVFFDFPTDFVNGMLYKLFRLNLWNNYLHTSKNTLKHSTVSTYRVEVPHRRVATMSAAHSQFQEWSRPVK